MQVNKNTPMIYFMKPLVCFFCIWWNVFYFLSCIAAENIQTLVLSPAENMTRAELHYLKNVASPEAVLVLCPGVNGNGRAFLDSKAWRDFSRKEQLGIVALSFASPFSAIHDGTGYYYASKGSGQVLLDGIRRIFGRDLPLVLCGFSGGAHFTSRFTEWKPERVRVWCAYSAGWWDEPEAALITPPGIVACGDADYRYGASIIYFKQGRAAGKPWIWVSLGGVGHTGSPVLEQFIREYFSAILSGVQKGVWVDVDLKTRLTEKEANETPALSGWLPADKLFENWKEIHDP